MPKAESVIGGGADGESGAGRGPASESCRQAASAGSMSRSSSAARMTSWTCAVAAVVLALLVNVVELACTAGLPAIYTQVLTAHHLPAWSYYGYLLLYIAAYMLDDALMVGIAVVTLSRTKLQERGGRALKLLNGLVMLVLGLALVARPQWLVW